MWGSPSASRLLMPVPGECSRGWGDLGWEVYSVLRHAGYVVRRLACKTCYHLNQAVQSRYHCPPLNAAGLPGAGGGIALERPVL